MRGFIKCVDDDYNIIYVKKDDIRLIEGKLTPIIKKYVTCKDSKGNTVVVFNNDHRLVSGGIISCNT